MLCKPLFPAVLQSPINAGAFCMIAGLVLVPLVSLFTRRPDAAHVEHVFSCYAQKVTVTARDSIPE
jgi:SSS family solute:Na+ symporter